MGWISLIIALFAIGVTLFYRNTSSVIFFLNKLLKSHPNSLISKEQRCLDYLSLNAIPGNATSVLNAIDKFGWEDTFLMNVGDVKGKILSDELAKTTPKIVVEVGAYIGYSAVRIASQLPPDSRLISVEVSPTNVNYARQTVAHAGLSDRVTFLEGTVTTSLKSYLIQENLTNFDFLFLDHHKGYYLSDLKYIIQEKLLQPDATIVADNVLIPGAPDYWFYVTFNSKFTTTSYFSQIEYLPLPDIVTVSKFLGYEN